MGKWEIRPLPRPNPLTDHHQKLHTWLCRGYLPKKITIPQRVSFPRMREIAYQRCLLGFFFSGSSNGPHSQPRPLDRFSRVIRQTTWFRARMCLFGVRKQKFNIYTRVEKRPFWASFCRDKIFGQEPLYNEGAPM